MLFIMFLCKPACKYWFLLHNRSARNYALPGCSNDRHSCLLLQNEILIPDGNNCKPRQCKLTVMGKG